MKILVIADMHGNFEKLTKVLNSLDASKFDLLICPGDFTDMFNLPPDFLQLDVADLVIQKLLALKIPLFCVPGNHDPYEILELFNEYNVNLHNQIRKFKNVNFLGWGGAVTPFNTIFEPSEEEVKESLTTLGEKIISPWILVVHNPPKDTKLDLTSAGRHVGSQRIRDFILNKKPLFAISAHIHEARGIDKINQTTLFYPGPVYDGYYGVVEVIKKKVKCEIKKVNI